jgi:hypothetical protein
MMISASLAGVANRTSMAALTPLRLLVTSVMNLLEGLYKSVRIGMDKQQHKDIIIRKSGLFVQNKMEIKIRKLVHIG